MTAPAGAISDVDVLDVSGAASLLGIGKHALYALCGKNAIPHRRVGKHLRFSRSALMKWLEGERSDGEMR